MIKNKMLKIFSCSLCAAMILVSFIFARAKEGELINNIALNKRVTISDGGVTSPSGLTDGLETRLCSTKFYDRAETTVFFEIDFEGKYEISSVEIIFRGDAYVPSDFTVDVWDGSQWGEVIRETGFTTVFGNIRAYECNQVVGFKIRIQATKLGSGRQGYAMQLAEMAVNGIRLAHLAGQPHTITATIYDSKKRQYGITWHSDTVYSKPRIQVVVKDSDVPDVNSVDEFNGIRYKGEKNYIYKGVISGLFPSTAYYYRVGDSGTDSWSEWGTFTTESKNNGAFTFFHMTDSQGGYMNWNAVLKQAFNLYSEAGLIVHTGDLVNWGPDEEEWKTALGVTSQYIRNTLLTSIAGSYHESQGKELFDHFNVNLPNGQDGIYGYYYSYDYNNAHFTMIDINNYDPVTGNLSDTQIEWIKNDLGNTDKPWKIVGVHWGLLSTGPHCSEEAIMIVRQQLIPIFSEFNVDLVLQGHDHVYTRTFQSLNGSKLNNIKTEERKYKGEMIGFDINPGGTFFVISNTVGTKFYEEADFDPDKIFPAKHGQPMLPMFSAITIDGNKLIFKSYTVDPASGETLLYDSYAVIKVFSAVDQKLGAFSVIFAIIAVLFLLKTVRFKIKIRNSAL